MSPTTNCLAGITLALVLCVLHAAMGDGPSELDALTATAQDTADAISGARRARQLDAIARELQPHRPAGITHADWQTAPEALAIAMAPRPLFED